MKIKKRMLICLIVLFCIGFILLVCSFMFKKRNKKPERPECSCLYTELLNKFKTCEWDIDILVEAPHRTKGYFTRAEYDIALNILNKEGNIRFETGTKSIPEGPLTGRETRKEAEEVLVASNITNAYSDTDIKRSLNNVITRDYLNYRIACIYDTSSIGLGSRLEKSHTAVLLIYKTETRELLYLAELTLNDSYCFPRTEGYFSVNDIIVAE